VRFELGGGGACFKAAGHCDNMRFVVVEARWK
jgi:hypothetical protein